ncbi:hypothetical protein [Vibrio cholerae]|uniref:hypothetical protein n=1 Tax=Vibrio cholerae TaxID=666 RepID=UPI00226DCD65|nr:hypothetical protein [Vibrio cholerae]MCX9579835.1 hypothetical protein [Vibrio cholerae]
MKAETYKNWQLFDDMPNGWMIDKTCGSPLAGYVFIINGISILRGGKRALIRMKKPQNQPLINAATVSKMETITDESLKVEHPYPARTVNELARERFKLKLLNDIRCDLMICELEGWSKMEYINEIRRLVNEIGNRVTIGAQR